MDTIILRGGGDLATGIAHRLFKSGYKVIILEIEKPTAIRRTVSFSEAIYSGQITVEGIKSVLAKDADCIYKILNKNCIPVFVDERGI